MNMHVKKGVTGIRKVMEVMEVVTSGITKLSATEYELQLSIRRSGFIPRRRNSDYDLLDTPDALDESPQVICEPPHQIVELV